MELTLDRIDELNLEIGFIRAVKICQKIRERKDS